MRHFTHSGRVHGSRVPSIFSSELELVRFLHCSHRKVCAEVPPCAFEMCLAKQS